MPSLVVSSISVGRTKDLLYKLLEYLAISNKFLCLNLSVQSSAGSFSLEQCSFHSKCYDMGKIISIKKKNSFCKFPLLSSHRIIMHMQKRRRRKRRRKHRFIVCVKQIPIKLLISTIREVAYMKRNF